MRSITAVVHDHYLMVTDDDCERTAEKAAQNLALSVHGREPPFRFPGASRWD
jgi:hypothetical protein